MSAICPARPRGRHARGDNESRFWERVEEHPSGCWLWIGTFAASGYGNAHWDGRRVRAHRVAYALVIGAIRPGYEVHHTCENKACVNPAHLEALSPAQHRQIHREALPSHCKRGHAYDEANTLWSHREGRLPYRHCRACAAIAARGRYARSPKVRANSARYGRERRARLAS